VPLRDQAFQVLAALVERPRQVVTRDELRHRLWPHEVFVDFDNALNGAVARLREALRDSAHHPRFVETIPRRGYRFIAPVSAAGPLADPAPGSRTDVTRDQKSDGRGDQRGRGARTIRSL
jgi:DNA-binding winged helix-turn-helix (wHTH) protein